MKQFRSERLFLVTQLSVLALAGCGTGDNPAATVTDAANGSSVYIGGEVCSDCHAEQAESWQGSHHELAMQTANASTVLGDFDQATFEYNGITTTFFVRGGEYFVNTEGHDGSLLDYRVTHTFGVDPLQQFLIEMPGGHFQALSIAWDSRTAESGGQRWLHLYPDESVNSDDPLHWTGTFQRWNTMCADCHSTNLVKNYQPATDTFATTWSSINVDCEACHGAGSLHSDDPVANPMLLAGNDRAWAFVEGAVTAVLQTSASATSEIDVCAQCHSRRSQLTDQYRPGDVLLDAYRPALLGEGLYHADGQILDEVYVYGSFLQSAMYAAGVTCSDCHEPHSTELRANGNAVCGQCHMASAFDTSEHHQHEAGTPGAECVNCHMRAETFMVVDPRRDHSFRLPRPDLTIELDTPNACADCHADQTPEWAVERITEWHPDGRLGEFHYGQALHAGRNWTIDRTEMLLRLIEDPAQPAIARASAIELISSSFDDVVNDVLDRQLDGGEELVQLAALDALAGVPLPLRAELGQRFLTHELRALRLSAARALLPVRSSLSESRRSDLDSALEEYLDAQEFNSDRVEGILNRASLLAESGQLAEAETTFLDAIEREPAFTATYINLAELYRQMGRESEAQEILRTGIDVVPEDPNLSLALGLSLVRADQIDEAVALIEQARELGANDPYNHYIYGVALNSIGEWEQSISVLRSAHELFPSYREILVALATILRDTGDLEQAAEYATRLVALAPSDGVARALLAELEAAQ